MMAQDPRIRTNVLHFSPGGTAQMPDLQLQKKIHKKVSKKVQEDKLASLAKIHGMSPHSMDQMKKRVAQREKMRQLRDTAASSSARSAAGPRRVLGAVDPNSPRSAAGTPLAKLRPSGCSSPMRSPKNTKAAKGLVFEDKYSPAPTGLSIGIPAIGITSDTQQKKKKTSKLGRVKRLLKSRAPAPPKTAPPPKTLRASVMMGIISDQQWKLDEMQAQQERVIQEKMEEMERKFAEKLQQELEQKTAAQTPTKNQASDEQGAQAGTPDFMDVLASQGLTPSRFDMSPAPAKPTSAETEEIKPLGAGLELTFEQPQEEPKAVKAATGTEPSVEWIETASEQEIASLVQNTVKKAQTGQAEPSAVEELAQMLAQSPRWSPRVVGLQSEIEPPAAIEEGEEEQEEEEDDEEEEEEEIVVAPEIVEPQQVGVTPRTAICNSETAKDFLAGIETASEDEAQSEQLAPVADGGAWEQYKTDEGLVYYYNSVTNVTTWDAPASMQQQQPTAFAPTVKTAVTVEKAKSKLWAMLGDGDSGEADALGSKFDDLVVTSNDLVANDGEAAATEEVDGNTKRTLGLCIGAELAAGKEALRRVTVDRHTGQEIQRSPNGTPLKASRPTDGTITDGGAPEMTLAMRLGSDAQFDVLCEALARRFPNRTGSSVSNASSTCSGWDTEDDITPVVGQRTQADACSGTR